MAEASVIPDLTAIDQATSVPRPAGAPAQAARAAAQEFEALFLAQVLNQMFSGVSTDGLFGGGVAEGVYRHMINDEYAKLISRSGGVGVGDAVYREILKLQEIE